MPRYFFHVRDGAFPLDDEGVELANIATARTEALRLAGAMIADNASRTGYGDEWGLDVMDHAGLVLFRIDFTVVEAPAVTATKVRPF